MPKVRFLLTNTRTGEQEVVGEIRLEGGRLVATMPAAERIASKPLEAFEDGLLTMIDPAEEPARFLAALPAAYNGSYMRAEALP